VIDKRFVHKDCPLGFVSFNKTVQTARQFFWSGLTKLDHDGDQEFFARLHHKIHVRTRVGLPEQKLVFVIQVFDEFAAQGVRDAVGAGRKNVVAPLFADQIEDARIAKKRFLSLFDLSRFLSLKRPHCVQQKIVCQRGMVFFDRDRTGLQQITQF